MLSSSFLLRPLRPTFSTATTFPHLSPPSLSFPSPPLRRHSLLLRALPTPPRLNAHETDHNTQKLKIAIVGFGKFGQFLAKAFLGQGHTVSALSRSDHSRAARDLNVRLFSDPDDLCDEHPQVIVLCTSVVSAEQALRSLPLDRLRRGTLFVDVLSVKEFAKNLLLDVLPPDFDILCSHPMFGPESARDDDAWTGLNFVYEKVRIGESRTERFLDIFANKGCNMVEMSCAEHDVHAAGLQFITHTVGRVLGALELESTPINTKGYESLLQLVDNTAKDSFDLYYGLFLYNKNAMQMLESLDFAFEALRNQLFGQLHGVVSKQLLKKTEKKKKIQTTIPQQSGHNFCLSDHNKLKIGIVGFGNFGQFLAKTIARQGHDVIAFSRTDYSQEARELGVSGFFSDPNDFCEHHPDVIILCTSILSTEQVLKSLPLHLLKRNTMFVDVLSVKEFPRNLFLTHLPQEFDVLCTHPMFGPESGRFGWAGLPFLYDKVRIGTRNENEKGLSRCDRFLDIFAREGCSMVEMSCEDHDRFAAGSQFLTHTVGRVLEKLGLESTPINTRGYETLLNLVQNTAGDSFDLYYGLFMYNVNAMEQLQRLEMAFGSLKKQVFGRLHNGLLQKAMVSEVLEMIG